MSHKPHDNRLLATNRRAKFDYLILDTFEAGIQLLGTEVKSIRDGKIQLRDSYVDIKEGEAFLMAAHVSPYSHGNRENHDPDRSRKLLLQRREIDRLFGKTQAKGLTIVPLKVYLVGNKIKVEIALVQGKKQHDKRQAEKEKQLDREVAETLSKKNW